MGIGFSSKSDGSTEAFLKRISQPNLFDQLEKYGQEGVRALSSATPADSGETASSWRYEVIKSKGTWSLVWSNTHVEDGRPIAVLLQYGHATRTGGRVEGRDYINPALQPIFDRIVNDGWKVVTQR